MNERDPLRVRDLMVSEYHSIDGLATVDEAIALMRRHFVNCLVVNRRNDDDEVGLIEVADIARRVIADNRPPERVNVYEIMSKPAMTVTADMLSRYAVRLLVRFGLSRAVVMDGEHNPVGIVSLRDLIIGLPQGE